MNTNTLLLIAPIAVISIGLLVFALYDLTRPDRQVRGGNKLIWALVIVLVSTFGPLIYLLAGREEA